MNGKRCTEGEVSRCHLNKSKSVIMTISLHAYMIHLELKTFICSKKTPKKPKTPPPCLHVIPPNLFRYTPTQQTISFSICSVPTAFQEAGAAE